MRRITLLGAATAAMAASLSGAGFHAAAQNLLTNDGMPQKKRIARSAGNRRGVNRMPHYGSKESAKVWRMTTAPNGYQTVCRIK